MMSPKDDGEKKIQSLIKIKMSELENLEGWKEISPNVTNAIRHAIIRTAFGSYKIGILAR